MSFYTLRRKEVSEYYFEIKENPRQLFQYESHYIFSTYFDFFTIPLVLEVFGSKMFHFQQKYYEYDHKICCVKIPENLISNIPFSQIISLVN